MIKNRTKLTLIVAANPKAYSSKGGMWAGEFSGSILAHYLHLWKQIQNNENNPGVFFTCSFESPGGSRGIAKFLDNLEKDKKEMLMKYFGKWVNNLQISKYGYFYEPRKKSITWRFKADGLRTYSEMNEGLAEKYLPYFHKYGIKERKRCGALGKKRNKREFLLIRKLEQLKAPIQKTRNVFKDFEVFTRNGKRKLKDTLIQPNVYVISKKVYPIKEKCPTFEDIISNGLFDVFSAKEKLHEKHIHNIFLCHLMMLGYRVTDEGKVKNGRFDVAYKDKRSHIVVEFKLGNADKDTLRQLEDYAKEYMENENIKKCKRIIVCHKATPKLSSAVRKKQKEGYKIIEYKLKIDFGNLFQKG